MHPRRPRPGRRSFLQAVVEAVSNDRPVAQLARWTSSRVYADLDARRKRVADQLSSSGKRHRIVATRSPRCASARSTPAIAEVSGRVVTGRRSRALAARLEFLQSRWTCTELVSASDVLRGERMNREGRRPCDRLPTRAAYVRGRQSCRLGS